MFNAYLTSNFFLPKTFYIFSSPLLHNGIQISYSLSFSSLDTLAPPQCPYMSPFFSKSPNAKSNATSAGGMQLAALCVCSPNCTSAQSLRFSRSLQLPNSTPLRLVVCNWPRSTYVPQLHVYYLINKNECHVEQDASGPKLALGLPCPMRRRIGQSHW